MIHSGLNNISKTIKFEIFKFDGKYFAMWKVKIHVILINNEYPIEL